MDMRSAYRVLRDEGVVQSQEEFSVMLCGMGPGYLRARVKRPSLEVMCRLHAGVDRLAQATKSGALLALRDQARQEISNRVGWR